MSTEFKYKKIQEVSRKYFETRTVEDFNAYHKALLPSVKKAARQITKDTTTIDDVASKVFMKMYLNPNFVFDNTKSHYSYIYNTTINIAKQVHNKNKPSICYKGFEDHVFEKENNIKKEDLEKLSPKQKRNRYSKQRIVSYASDISNVDEDIDILEFLHHANNGDTEKMDEINCGLFHEDMNQQLLAVENIISNLDTEQRLIFTDSINKVNYSEIKEKYNLNSEGAVKTRVHRIRRAVKIQYDVEMDSSHMLDSGETKSGLKKIYFNNDASNQLKFKFHMDGDKLHGPATEFYQNGIIKKESIYYEGTLNGICKEFDDRGRPTMITNYEMGVFHGQRTRFHQGEIDEMVDYLWGEKCYYELYEDGKVVEQGIFDDQE